MSHLSPSLDCEGSRTLNAFNPQRLLPAVRRGSRAVIGGPALYWGPLRLMIALRDCITVKEYEAILQNQVHPGDVHMDGNAAK